MKFGKKLARTVQRMPLEHRDKLFLDYKMLKGHIKRVVNASKASVSKEQVREAAQHPEHYHNELLEWPLAVTSAAFDVGDQSIIAREGDVQDGVEDELLDVIMWPITAAVMDSTVQAMPLTWEGVEGWEGLESAWLSTTNTDGVLEDNEIQQPISLTFSEGVNGRPSTAATAPPCSHGLEAGLEPEPNLRHMRVEGVDPAAVDEPNSVFPLFYSRRNNSIGARGQNADVQMELEVRRFKRMLDVEFIKINKRFVTIFLQNGELMGKLDVMRKEEEDKQRRLHPSGHTFFWDITELKSIRFRLAILYVDILIFHYCNAANYEAAVKILKKFDKHIGSDLRWSYLHHVKDQMFYVLAERILDSANHCRYLMSLGTIQPLPVSEEQLQRQFNKVGAMTFKLLDARALALETRSSTHNAQSLYPPAATNS
ncbi:unnamed protein product [Sphagnum balticum]